MTGAKRTVLITGCSDGGLGAALAVAFHKAGLHVYATARNLSKMEHLSSLGISTLSLDVQSDSSIATCIAQIPSLDILVNNAGAIYTMPFSDLSISQAKALFDLNVWSYLVVTQAFLPLLLTSKGMIVNQTSGASVLPVPFQSTYNASKAAIACDAVPRRVNVTGRSLSITHICDSFADSPRDICSASWHSEIQLNLNSSSCPFLISMLLRFLSNSHQNLDLEAVFQIKLAWNIDEGKMSKAPQL